MLDEYYKILNHRQIFEERLPMIIETFVSFYGEEKRKYITNRFNNTTFITYLSLQSLNSIISNMKKIKTKELLNKIKDNFTEEEFKTYFDDDEFSLSFILKYYKLIDDVKNGKVDRIPFNFRYYDENITIENILNNNLTEKMQRMMEVQSLLEPVVSEYNSFLETIAQQDKILIDTDKLEKQLESEAVMKFIEHFKNKFPKEDFELFEKIKARGGKIYPNQTPTLNVIMGSNLKYDSPIMSFSEENSQMLLNEPEWKQNTIKRNRMDYFKSFGINLGNDYEAYMSNEDCLKLIPSQELIVEVTKFRKQIRSDIKKAVNSTYIDYAQGMQRFERNSIFSNTDYDELFNTNGTFALSDLAMEEGGIKEKTTCFINMANDIEILDAQIIHECNHLYELSYDISGDKIHTMCGWHPSESTYNPETGKYDEIDGDCKYIYLNEIINDFFAQKITKMMHSNGMSIFTNPQTAQYGRTGYQKTHSLVDDFFATYYDTIMQSRFNGQINLIKEKVGSENYESLCDLFLEFNDQLGGFNYYNCLRNFKENKETDLTQKYKEIIGKRDIILQNMSAYSLGNNNKTL